MSAIRCAWQCLAERKIHNHSEYKFCFGQKMFGSAAFLKAINDMVFLDKMIWWFVFARGTFLRLTSSGLKPLLNQKFWNFQDLFSPNCKLDFNYVKLKFSKLHWISNTFFHTFWIIKPKSPRFGGFEFPVDTWLTHLIIFQTILLFV